MCTVYGSDNGLLPDSTKTNTWTNVELFLNENSRKHLTEIAMAVEILSNKIHLKIVF